MTTYDAIRNHTTVWTQIRRLTPTERLLGREVGDWRPLFWFHGRAD